MMSSGDFTITAPHNKKKYLDNVVGPFTAYQQQINVVLSHGQKVCIHRCNYGRVEGGIREST